MWYGAQRRTAVLNAVLEGTMRPNAAKQRLLAGEPAIGIFVAANSPLVAEAVGKTGLS